MEQQAAGQKRAEDQYRARLKQILTGLFFCIVLFCMLLLVTGISSDEVNPDEPQTGPAVLYYRTHFWPADIRKLGDEYFSGYGMTRLWELTPFYLLAGKLSLLSDAYGNFRYFGVALAVLIMGVCIGMLPKYPAFSLVFLATPQVWYLFSYATSDAFDYTLSVICLYQLLKRDSLLNRLLDGTRRGWAAYPALGLLFALVLMGKKNYYLTDLWVFGVLLLRLWHLLTAKEKKAFFGRCLILLTVSLTILGIREAYDQKMYGFRKAEVIREQMELRALSPYRESTAPEEQAPSLHLHAKGVGVWQFFTEYSFFDLLGKSFAGLFGIYKIGTNDLYYLVFYLDLLAILILWGRAAFRERGDPFPKRYYIFALLLTVMGFALVVYNAYMVDYQPQGRYLFPLIPIWCYGLGITKGLWDSRVFRALIAILPLMSLLFYACVGTPRLLALG